MAWKKGQSGNPGGRRKQDFRIKDLAQSYTEEGLKVLAQIMRNKKTSAGARVLAVREIFDRGWGRPPQSVDITNSDGSMQDAWKAAIRAADGILPPAEEAEVTH